LEKNKMLNKVLAFALLVFTAGVAVAGEGDKVEPLVADTTTVGDAAIAEEQPSAEEAAN
jgi:hypothetical protein